MADVSAADIAALRKQTGAGMLDCKKALEESGGDLDAAKDWLRTKGLAGASKRAGRAADNGAIDVAVDGTTAALVELTCETDFVAKGADFTAIIGDLVNQVLEGTADGLADQPFIGDASQTVGEAVTQLGSKLGEKVELGRVVRYDSPDGILDGYKHLQNDRGTVGVIVELGGVSPADPRAREVAHDIALHIASAGPRYVTRADVPAEVVDKERAVLEELTRNEGKPEQALPKIIEGRLNGFYKDNVLLEQGFVKEPKTTVASLVDSLGGDAEVRRFARVKIGEE
ncbi:MAG TPA: translation elongation factor Ts [Acidimicrobiia bacterium]